MGIEKWSTSAGSNNMAPPDGWPGGMLPSQVEPTGRQMMASIASWYQAAEWINYNNPIVYISATQFSVATNVTATFQVGRRVQATDGSTVVYGTISASVFTSLTTVTVVWDTGVLQTGVTIVYVGIISAVNTSAPLPNPATVTMTGQWTFSGNPVVITNNAKNAIAVNSAGTNYGTFQNDTADTWSLGTTAVPGTLGTSILKWVKAGNVTVNAPTTGNAVTITSAAGATGLSIIGGANGNALTVIGSSTTGQSFGQFIAAGTNSSDVAFLVKNQAQSASFFQVSGTGVVSGNDGTSLFELGYKDIPQNLQTGNYSPALSDRGKGVDFNGTSLTCTIPANASVAFPVGATIVITNLNASSLSIAITTDTLTLAGTTTTGTRALSQNGMATIRKVTSTSWLISGSGVS